MELSAITVLRSTVLYCALMDNCKPICVSLTGVCVCVLSVVCVCVRVVCVCSNVSNRAINLLNAELNPICHSLTLLGAHLIFCVSGLRVKGIPSVQKANGRTDCPACLS
jgi:hypothetical protein